MGGDIAVALAGVDDRVRQVATAGSTPDWQRPGMTVLDDPGRLVDQGEPDRYAQWYADRLDPARHVERYRRGVDVLFELGEDDQHIPAANAVAFRDALRALDPAAADRIRLSVRPGLDHLGIVGATATLDSLVDALC